MSGTDTVDRTSLEAVNAYVDVLIERHRVSHAQWQAERKALQKRAERAEGELVELRLGRERVQVALTARRPRGSWRC